MRFKITLCQASKLIFIVYMFYEMALRRLFVDSNALSYGMLFIALLLQLMYDKRIKSNTNITMLLAFFVISLGSSYIVAVDYRRAAVYLFLFLKYVLMAHLVIRYSDVDKDIDFAVKLFIAVALFIAILVITVGYGEYRLTYSEDVNVNGIGVTMMFGIAFLLYYFIDKPKNILNTIVYISLTLFLLYITMRTVSKKAIIGSLLLLVLWFIVCYGKAFKNMGVVKRTIILVFLGIVAYFSYQWFINERSSVYQYLLFRFGRLNANDNGSTQERLYLIKEGFAQFLDNPIIGVGFNNFRYHNMYNTYSHCFYIELLVCCGLTGAALFFIPLLNVIRCFTYELRVSKLSGYYLLRTKCKYLLCIYFGLLLLAVTQIIFYEFELMYCLAVLFGYACLLRQGYLRDAETR